jgi:hypothetical protein
MFKEIHSNISPFPLVLPKLSDFLQRNAQEIGTGRVKNRSI